MNDENQAGDVQDPSEPKRVDTAQSTEPQPVEATAEANGDEGQPVQATAEVHVDGQQDSSSDES